MQTKNTSITERESYIWRSLRGLSAGRGKRVNVKKAWGLRSTNLSVQNRQGVVKEKYRKWRSQRTYMCDPWT